MIHHTAPLGTRLGKLLALCLGSLMAASAGAIDVYNPSNNQLAVAQVSVGSSVYTNVVVSLAGVVSVGSMPAMGTMDSYNPQTQQLTIPAVIVGNLTFHNVVVNVAGVVSVGPPVAAVGAAYSLGVLVMDVTGLSVTLPLFLSVRSSFRYWTSLCSFCTSASSFALISFLRTRCMTHLARSANLSVLIVSSMLSITGDTVAIRKVFVLPPRESCNSLVSFDSLNG
jgi:hypothetical protein